MKYELYEEEDGALSFSLAPKNPNGKLIWSVDAKSYDEAFTEYHKYMGWEPYIPL